MTPGDAGVSSTEWFLKNEAPGWKTGKQTLHQAENRYASSTPSAGYLHLESTWKDGKGMTNTQPYADGDAQNYDNAWIPANAGSNNSYVGAQQFAGGFAGKCPQGESWQLAGPEGNQEWECQGAFTWTQPVMLPSISADNDEYNIGIGFYPFNAKQTVDTSDDPDATDYWFLNSKYTGENWNTYFEAAANSDVIPDGDRLESVDVICYPYSSDWRPDGIDDQSDFDPSDGSAAEGEQYIMGEDIPVSSSDMYGLYGEVNMQDNNSYFCQWRYHTQISDPATTNFGQDSDAGEVVELNKYLTGDQLELQKNFTDLPGRMPAALPEGAFNQYEPGLCNTADC